MAVIKESSGKEIRREVFALALPAIASNITVPLLGLCDTAITGHLGDALYLAAIAAGGMMLNVIYWLCGFLRMGVTGLTAEAFGAGRRDVAGLVLSRALLLSLVIGMAVLLLNRVLAALLLSVINPGEDVIELAAGYFEICIWGAPALLATLSINGWFIGMQNTTLPMVVSIGVNVINIVCSLLAVYVFRAGFDGVAAGTLIANLAGVLLGAFLLRRFMRCHGIRLDFRGVCRNDGLRKFFNVSGDLFLRSACLMVVSLGMTSFGARLGDTTLAVNTVAMQYFLFFSYFVDGFAFSGEALCGRFSGASDKGSLWRSVREIIMIALSVSLSFTVIYAVGGDAIAGMLTDVQEVREGIDSLGLFLTALPLVSVAAFIFDGFYIGMTATRRMLLTTLAAMTVFYAIVMLTHETEAVSGNRVLWTAFLSYLFVRGAGLALQMRKMVEDRMKN